MQQQYLRKDVKTFYDPHGSGDYGGFTLSVVENDKYDDYSTIEEGVEYSEDWEKVTPEMEENWYGEDGYNCEITTFTIKKITNEDSIKYKKIIKDYEDVPI